MTDAEQRASGERPADDDGQAADAEAEKAVGQRAGVTAAELAAEIAELKAELETVKGEADKRLDGWQRAQADLENYKKHATQDLADRVRLAKTAVLMDLLNVVDDFERALAADHETDPHAWIDGVRLIERKFYAFLEQKELSPIAAENQRFDPNFHDALGQAPGPEGQVIAQLQKGYLLGDKVLRPARVIVGNGDDVDSSPATDADRASEAGGGGDQHPSDDAPEDAHSN